MLVCAKRESRVYFIKSVDFTIAGMILDGRVARVSDTFGIRVLSGYNMDTIEFGVDTNVCWDGGGTDY